jgi:hypothetical protein
MGGKITASRRPGPPEAPSGLLFLHFMRQAFFGPILLILSLFTAWEGFSAPLSKLTQPFGITVSTADSIRVRKATNLSLDSLIHAEKVWQAVPRFDIQKNRPFHNRTADFYILCGFCILLGLLRYADPRFMQLLMTAYRGGGRQWKELLQASALTSFFMNLFFCFVAGAYIYYVTAGITEHLLGDFPSLLMLPILIGGMIVIYLGKFLVIRFSGWLFKAETLASEYLFNVFLVNKIISVILLPFVILLALGGPQWFRPVTILSGVVVLALISTRYLRSWSAFYAFFKGSRFHFFTYLCASEILPMAVLVKWLLHFIL